MSLEWINKLLIYYLIWMWRIDIINAESFYNLPNNQLVDENTSVNSTVFVIGIQNNTAANLTAWWSPSPAEGSTLFELGPVDSSEIVVSTQSELDFESLTATSFTFIIVILDPTDGATATGTLTLSIRDVNEPGTWSSSSYYTSVLDGAAVGHIIQYPGFSYMDPDVGDSGSCSMDCQSDNGYFSMSPSCNITVTTSYSLDTRGASSSFGCNVVVIDNGANSATTTLTISIVDANNFAPVFDSASYQFTISPHELADSNIGRARATDNDMGTTYGDFTYSLDQSAYPTHYFKIDSDTGQISTQLDMSTCNCPLNTFSLPVHATDLGGLVGSSVVHITTGVTTTTIATTTTTPPPTTTAVYKTFFEDKGNIAWFSILLVLIAVTVCVTAIILLKYGCRSLWFTKRMTKTWITLDKQQPMTPKSIRPPPPHVRHQAWRNQNTI